MFHLLEPSNIDRLVSECSTLLHPLAKLFLLNLYRFMTLLKSGSLTLLVDPVECLKQMPIYLTNVKSSISKDWL